MTVSKEAKLPEMLLHPRIHVLVDRPWWLWRARVRYFVTAQDRFTEVSRRDAIAAKHKTPAKHASSSAGATVSGTDPCTCGHAPEEHGHDAKYPSSTACTECDDCIAYEADPQD